MYVPLILLLVPLVAATLTENASQQPSRITNATFSEGSFSYTGETGPLGWAGLSHDNALCSSGRWQSPINLDNRNGSPIKNPSVGIPDGYVDFTNNGHTVQASAVGTTTLNGKAYALQQFHFHTPSEHRINEEWYPLEVHFVHRAQDGSLLVLGAVFEITTDGTSTPFVSTLARQVRQISVPGTVTRVYNLPFAAMINLFQSFRLFQYSGSLTTPPCSEGITWLVSQQPLAIDTASYLAFKNVLKFNSRYTQNFPGQQNLIEMAASQLQQARYS